MNFVRENVHPDMVNVPLQIDKGVLELVDAVIEGRVRAMVAVQRGPQAPNHVNEAPQPLGKGIFRFVEGQRPPSSLAASTAVGRGCVPGPHAVLSRGGGLRGAGRRGSVRGG